MTDKFSPEKRHEIMASIHSKNSKAEILAFRFLKKEGIYFQKHYEKAQGKPDIALPRRKKACFIDGDFWHGRSFDELRKKRGENDYWTKKIKRNLERDKEQRESLRINGWQILYVWESDLLRKRTCSQTLDEIKRFLTTT